MSVAIRQREGRAVRRAPRRKLFQPAEMRGLGGSQRVHLLDISTAGGQVHAAQPPLPGTIVTLVCETFSRSARVAWVDDRRIGVAFVLPLSEAEVDAVAGG